MCLSVVDSRYNMTERTTTRAGCRFDYSTVYSYRKYAAALTHCTPSSELSDLTALQGELLYDWPARPPAARSFVGYASAAAQWLVNGRTFVVEGGTTRFRCEKCSS